MTMKKILKTVNGYRHGQKNRHRRLCNQQEDSEVNEGRIPTETGHSHSLQNVQRWGTEHPIRTEQKVQSTEKKGSLQKKNVKKKKPMTMGRVHL